MDRVGFVGLGNLGQPMARALLRAGWPVTVLDTDPARARPCAEEGATVAGSPDELAGCPVLAFAVPDDRAIDEVLGPLLPHLAPGGTVLIHSTVLPAAARRLAAGAARYEIGLLDAPVSGGAERALAGELTVMVGGEEAVLTRARPVLETVGSQIHHVGPAGAGAAVKLANQLMMFAALAGVHEAVDLAAAYGVGERAVLDAAASGTGASWAATNWGFFDRVAAEYEAGGTAPADRPWHKDLAEVVEAAGTAGLDLPVAALLARRLGDVVDRHAHEATP
jgi:3-hydroxyisobutyrate dehydrogenase-like beta-hydroxyacid dehydrogenase